MHFAYIPEISGNVLESQNFIRSAMMRTKL